VGSPGQASLTPCSIAERLEAPCEAVIAQGLQTTAQCFFSPAAVGAAGEIVGKAERKMKPLWLFPDAVAADLL